MIGTPRSFAGTPDSTRGGYDVLAEMLRAVHLTGSVFLNARFSQPFGVVSPKQYDERTPLAHLRHVSIFHLIAEGACTIEIATGERRTISAGDILLLPFADAHKFWNGDTAAAVRSRAWFAASSNQPSSCSLRCSAPCRHW